MENMSMEELLKSYDEDQVKRGEVLEGTIISMPDDKTVVVAIKNTEGTLHLDHYTKDKNVTSFKEVVKVGDTIKVKVATITTKETKNEEHTKILLSCLDIVDEKVIEELKSLTETGTPVTVLVDRAADNKGYVATYKGVSLFIPRSMSTAAVVPGKEVEVKLVTVEENEGRTKIIASRREIENAEYNEGREKELEGINEGDVLTGKVIKIEKYGAIVKFNYVTGLLLAGQVSHQFVDITKELTVGQDIEVKVIKKENGKLNLSRKALIDSPFTTFVKANKVSDTVKGKVTNKLPYGLLIELAEGVKGLLHVNEYSYNPNDNFAASVKIGDEIEVSIINIAEDKERISLSRKPLLDNPWANVTAKAGDTTTAKVTDVNEKGLKVDAFGVEGLVPASEATKEKGNLADFFAVGDEVEVIVLDVKPREWKLKLSINKLKDAKERKEFEKHLTTEETPVTIGDALNSEDK